MECQQQKHRVIQKSVNDIFAPVMYSFVSWILQQAEEKQIKRLYFLARDGYQMYLSARILCEEQGIDVDCRYLKCSRYALRVPVYHIQKETCLTLICQGGIDVTLRKVLKRTGMDNRTAEEMAEMLGLEKQLDEILSYRQVQDLKEMFRQSAAFMNWIYEHSEKEYPKAVGYLQQEGLLDEVSYAIVDSGWIGTLQQTLQMLLWQEGKKSPLQGFYFGLYELPAGADPFQYHTFYFSPHGKIRRKVYFSNSLFECIFGAPEGMTLGYEASDGTYQAVLEQKENRNRAKVEETADVLCRRVRVLAKEGAHITLKQAEDLLARFMGTPSPEEVEEFGNWKFTDDVLEEKQQIVAADLNETELSKNHFFKKALIMLGIRKGPVHESAWIEGSAVRCGRHVRRHLRKIRQYKYVLYVRKEVRKKCT